MSHVLNLTMSDAGALHLTIPSIWRWRTNLDADALRFRVNSDSNPLHPLRLAGMGYKGKIEGIHMHASLNVLHVKQSSGVLVWDKTNELDSIDKVHDEIYVINSSPAVRSPR